uniref:Fibrinogen C-terminal domain-containing protein n=1 Tax=Astyanax mexicanus TaxID=7994 RepID=A0A8B9LJC7_ASTMX
RAWVHLYLSLSHHQEEEHHLGPNGKDTDTEDTSLSQVGHRSAFAALDDVRLIANGLLQLGKNLRDFVQKTKGQINDILQKLNIFDKSFYQLSVLASEIKEEEEELKKTTVVLKASNDEIKSLSLEINSKVEDIMKERIQLRNQVGGLEEKLSGISQGLLSADQVAEISALKVRTLWYFPELNSASHQETTAKLRWDLQTYSMSDYLTNYSTDGSFSSDFPKDCGEAFSMGENASGLYAIKPNQSEAFLVLCEFTEDGAFTVIQRRQDGSVDFNQPWQSYEDGFGDFRSEFWLGLRKIFSISQHGGSLLHVQMEDWKQEKHLMEFQYRLEGPASNYTIHLRPAHLSTETDTQTGMRFSTKDHHDENNSRSCAHDYTGGWWFSTCDDINPNGKCIQSRPRRKHNKGHVQFKSSQISIFHAKKT